MMKRPFLLIVTCFFLFSFCLVNIPVYGQHRTIEDARSIVNNFISYGPRKVLSQNGNLSFNRFEKVQSSIDILQGGMMNDESFYIFSNTNSQPGFIIVSGDERMSEVLGYSFTDFFDENNIPDALVDLLKQYQKEWIALQNIPTEQRTTTIRTEIPRRIGSSEGVPPLLQTEWDQSTPYNNKCPLINGSRAVTGCVATAAAQVMNFYQHPTTGNGSITYTTSTNNVDVAYDFSSKTFDWDHMLNDYSKDYSTKQGNAVAELMAACGAMCQMDYGVDASGTNTYNMMTGAINYMNYDKDAAYFSHDYTTESNWQQNLVNELDAGHPVILSGITNNNEGHCFVADGYESDEEYPSFHINWGWSGLADGYYKTTSLKPEQAGIGGVADSFSNDLVAILNFQPENGIVDIDSNFQGESLSVSPKASKPNTATNVTFTIRNMYNYSSKTFNGVLKVYIDKEGCESKYLETVNLGTVEPLYGCESASFDCTLPADLTLGTYTFRLTSSQNGGSTESDVNFASGNPKFIVSDTGVDPDAPEYSADIQVTDIQVEESSTNPGNFTMTLTQIANFASLAFDGDIKMAIADDDNNVVLTFGEPTTISQLGHYRVLTYPRTLTATWSDSTLTDGHYRLGAAANQTGYNGWTMVKKFTLSDGYITSYDEDAYLDCWIKSGKLTFESDTIPGKAKAELQLKSATASSSGYWDLTFNASFTNNEASSIKLKNVELRRIQTNEILKTWTCSDEIPSSYTYTYTLPYSIYYGSSNTNWQDLDYSENSPVFAVDFYYITNEQLYFVTSETIKATGITLDKKSLELKDGETATINATILPENVSSTDVNWTSDNPSVATVKNGLITAVGVGSANIIATTTDGSNLSDSCKVTVLPVYASGLTLDKEEIDLTALQQQKLTATISPSNVTSKTLQWTSDNPSIATVAEDGTVSAVDLGTATITVKTTDGTELTAKCKVNVTTKLAEQIVLAKDEIDVPVGETYNLDYSVLPDNASNKELTWSSDNKDIATADKNGVVSAHNIGKAVITATTTDGSNISSTCSINVVPCLVASITIDPDDTELYEGVNLQLALVITPEYATNQAVEWKSSDTSIAKVSSKGLVKAIKAGHATITVNTTDGSNLTATCEITVLPVLASSLTLNETETNLEALQQKQLVATISPSNVSNNTLEWSSDNTAVATVSEDGIISAIDFGTATITVKTTDGTGLTATCRVNVTTKLVESVSFAKNNVEVPEGESLKLECIVLPENATYKDLQWSSSDESILTVYAGIVSALQQGTAVVTAKSTDGSEKTAQCIVVVAEPSGIFNIQVYDNIEGIYTLDGKKVENPHGGMYIIKFKDGTVMRLHIK